MRKDPRDYPGPGIPSRDFATPREWASACGEDAISWLRRAYNRTRAGKSDADYCTQCAVDSARLAASYARSYLENGGRA